jgi:hypothetical protein
LNAEIPERRNLIKESYDEDDADDGVPVPVAEDNPPVARENLPVHKDKVPLDEDNIPDVTFGPRSRIQRA